MGLRIASVFGIIAALSGCGGEDPDRPNGIGFGTPGNEMRNDSFGGAAVGGDGDEGSPEGYPSRPYGQNDPQVGDVIENVHFEGYRRIGDGRIVSEGTFERFTLADLRDEGGRYALIHIAKIWCASCRVAADDLQAQADSLDDDGVLVLEIVLEGTDFEIEPTEEELDAWIAGSDLTMTTVKPTDERLAEVFPTHEFVYIVDLETMQVDWALESLDTDPTVTELGLEALAVRL